jgi:hypothetical protein
MTRSSHPPRLDYSNYTWRRVQITKLLVMPFSGQFYIKWLSRNKMILDTTITWVCLSCCVVWTMSDANISFYFECLLLYKAGSWSLRSWRNFKFLPAWYKDWWNLNRYCQFPGQDSFRDVTGSGRSTDRYTACSVDWSSSKSNLGFKLSKPECKRPHLPIPHFSDRCFAASLTQLPDSDWYYNRVGTAKPI